MKVITLVTCVVFLSTFAHASPIESLKTAGNSDQVTDGKKGDSMESAKSLVAVQEKTTKDKETHPESPDKSKDETKGNRVESKKKCADVVCGEIPKPSDAECRASNEASTLNVFNPFIGKISDCCPLWFCLKADGSFYFHYGVDQLKDIELGEVKSSVSSKFAYSNTFGKPPPPNQLPGNTDFAFRPVFHGQNPANQFGLPAGQPGFSPIGPFPQQQQFPNHQHQQPQFQGWEGYRERRNTFSQFQQPQQLGASQQNNFRQNPQENFRGLPVGPNQFF